MSKSESNDQTTIKLVLLGDGAVGKTTLRQVYMGEGYEASYLPTLGADIRIKIAYIDNHPIKFQIWDLAGHPRFDVVRKRYYLGAEGAFLVYDISNSNSLYNLTNWIQELLTNIQKEIPLIVIGNKIDLRQSASDTLTTEQGIKFLEKTREEFRLVFPLYFIETSAKTGENVNEAFAKLGKAVLGEGS